MQFHAESGLVLLQNVQGTICRPCVEDDVLEADAALLMNRAEALLDVLTLIKAGGDNRELWLRTQACRLNRRFTWNQFGVCLAALAFRRFLTCSVPVSQIGWQPGLAKRRIDGLIVLLEK